MNLSEQVREVDRQIAEVQRSRRMWEGITTFCKIGSFVLATIILFLLMGRAP